MSSWVRYQRKIIPIMTIRYAMDVITAIVHPHDFWDNNPIAPIKFKIPKMMTTIAIVITNGVNIVMRGASMGPMVGTVVSVPSKMKIVGVNAKNPRIRNAVPTMNQTIAIKTENKGLSPILIKLLKFIV